VLRPLALGVGVLLAAGACRFWYKPVPVENAVGEEKTVLAGDTMRVYRDARFEVYGPNPEAVYDGFEQLNRAYRAFERYFGSPVPRLAMVLADTAVRIEGETLKSFRDRGFTVVAYDRPRSVRSRRRYGTVDYGGVMWPIAPSAARALLARFADQQRESDPARVDSTLRRFPLWYRAAVIHLVGEAAAIAFANDLDYVRDKKNNLLPFLELLTLVRGPDLDSLLDPSRRGDADENTRIMAAQSSTIGRFLVEHEGPAVLARLGRGYVAGRPIEVMIGEFRTLPRSIPALEERWKQWIERLAESR
jgi:hypothetical protein